MMRTSRLWAVWLQLFGLVATLWGQINESDSLPLQMRLGLSAIYQTGNVEFFSLRGKAEASCRLAQGAWVIKGQAQSLNQYFGRFKADQDLSARLFLYYRPSAKLYPFALSFASSNYRRRLAWAYFAGLGGTWQIWQAEGQMLKFSMAGVYEQAYFRADSFNLSTYDGLSQINLWRPTVYLSGKHRLARGWQLFYDAYWQPALSDWANYRFFFDLGLSWQIWPGLSLQLLYWRNQESLAPRGVKPQDAVLTFGFSYHFQAKP